MGFSADTIVIFVFCTFLSGMTQIIEDLTLGLRESA